MRVTIEAINAYVCDAETERFLLTRIYGLMNCTMRDISCLTSDGRSMSEI
jgi:hypothetical protein